MFAVTRFFLCQGSDFSIDFTITGARMCFVKDVFIKKFVKLSGSHCTCDLSESTCSYFMFNILVIRN